MSSNYLDLATHAALKAGEILKKHWGKLVHIQEKTTPGDLVTEADRESEDLIIKMISKEYPSHVILSEEAGIHEAKNKDFLWVIDPLDGTTNYTHMFPMVAISIALYEKGQPLAGVVYNPILNEMFQAVRGQGATLNQDAIHVSSVSSLSKSLLATGFSYDRRETDDNNFAEFCHLTNSCQGVRRAGAASLDLAYVACGRLDGHWEIGLCPWDVAAGALLIEEGGGKVTSFDNHPLDIYSGMILATNGKIHQQIIDELQKIRNRSKTR